MRCEIRKFEADDARRITLQSGQAQTEWEGMRNAEAWAYCETHGHSFTAVRDGRLLGCMGLQPIWPGRATAWSLLSVNVKGFDLVWITRRVIAFLDAIQQSPDYRRVEMATAQAFPPACRWAKILGFEVESVLRCYGHDGTDWLQQVRIRPIVTQARTT